MTACIIRLHAGEPDAIFTIVSNIQRIKPRAPESSVAKTTDSVRFIAW